jgi:hypothetical protein
MRIGRRWGRIYNSWLAWLGSGDREEEEEEGEGRRIQRKRSYFLLLHADLAWSLHNIHLYEVRTGTGMHMVSPMRICDALIASHCGVAVDSVVQRGERVE